MPFPGHLMGDFDWMSLEISIQLFFSHFCFLVIYFFYPCDVLIISGRCNQFFFALFYVVFETSYRFINAELFLIILLLCVFCAASRRESFSLLIFPFLSHIHIFSGEISLVELSIQLFFFFVFWLFFFCWCLCCLYRFWSLKSVVLWTLHVIFKSLYRCINAVFSAGKSSSSFFSWHI